MYPATHKGETALGVEHKKSKMLPYLLGPDTLMGHLHHIGELGLHHGVDGRAIGKELHFCLI